MTVNHDPAALSAALRKAATEGNWKEVERLLALYTGALAESRNPRTLTEARDLVEWTRRLALGRKAAIAAELAAIQTAPRGYRPASLPSRHTWELEG